LSDLVSVGVLTPVFPPALVDEVIAEAGRTEQRHLVLPARVMAYFSIGMALYSEGSYEDVLAQLTDGLSWVSGWQESYSPPSKSGSPRLLPVGGWAVGRRVLAGGPADRCRGDAGCGWPAASCDRTVVHATRDFPRDRTADGPTRLEIIAGGVELIATLRDTQAARDLIEQLPLTLSMGDHGGVEKNGSLPQSHSVADDPDGADPEVADLGYYAPSNDLVLYYGDQSYYDGIVILGRLQGDVGALPEMDDDLDVHVRRLAP
jgi:hypothetical protein